MTGVPGEIRDFVRDAVRRDLAEGRHDAVVTRFPPEPNGYLHLGHAKAVCLNFGIAREFGGRCGLRFDDTNPVRESREYADAIAEDIRWLGFEWDGEPRHASEHFGRLFEWAEILVRNGDAYVDDLSAEEMRRMRGTLTEPGVESPFRERPAEENLDLLRRMRAGEFPDGARVLRARIDMASGNLNLRDPVLYRIVHARHPRTGDSWCVYPTYDFAHGQCDALEGVTHSLCTLEFADHRPLYDWLVERLPVPARPRQYEFARLELSGTVLSKRRLAALVGEGRVAGWDDPRMPTLSGLRRRGVPPEAIRDFVSRIAISRNEGVVDAALLDHCIRERLNAVAPRRMGVLRPLKLVIENYPERVSEELEIANDPRDPDAGVRRVPFSREIWIERDDFMEEPPKRFFRLAPGREVRLRGAYLVTCTGVVRDEAGAVRELRCVHDPESRGGSAPDGRKVRGALHWVSAPSALDAEIRLHDALFDEGGERFNPDSLETLRDCKLEPALAGCAVGEVVQFERLGYFCPDPDSEPRGLVFNRTIKLRDSFAKALAAGPDRVRPAV